MIIVYEVFLHYTPRLENDFWRFLLCYQKNTGWFTRALPNKTTPAQVFAEPLLLIRTIVSLCLQNMEVFKEIYRFYSFYLQS